MLNHPDLTEKRIEQFVYEFLGPRLFVGDPVALQIEFCKTHAENQQAASKAKWTKVAPAFRWGPPHRAVWFRAAGVIPRP